MEDEKKHLVIATEDPGKALFIVAKDAVPFDELELWYKEKYAPCVEYILRILRKGFGWTESDRGVKTVINEKNKTKIHVNFVVIEKIGQIKGL